MEKGRILGGRYKVMERIGSGGMSTVYKAHEVGLEREVAVKVLITALSSEPQLVERFNREARTIAGLQHNSIIPIYFYGVEDDFGSYLVMPLLKGGTLDQRLEQLTIRPSLTEVGETAERLGSALQYAHDKGIVHRDIKFSNIMFDDAGNPYLMDFGIAKMLGATNLTGTGMTVGTPQFMPPEQWRNDVITPAVDQYAFAILIYAMLTQRMPFDAPTPHALMYQHLQESPPLARDFREDVPQEIEDALHKALSKDPADRFDSISEFTSVISSKALSTTRQYSGFFKAPLSFEKGQTGIGTSIHSPQKMPNTPTEMVAKASTRAGATSPSSNNRETKAPTQIQSEPITEAPKNNNNAFWGGLVATVVIGVIIIGGLFIMSQSETPIVPTEVIEAGLDASATVINAEAMSVDETGTSVALLAVTDEVDKDTPVPSDTATSTDIPNTATTTQTATIFPSSTPNATGTQLVIILTENGNQQATESAELALTGTALAELAIMQSNNAGTATREAENANATTSANLNTANTATVEVITQIAAQANQDATNTAIDISNTQDAVISAQASVTAQSANIVGTATAFANLQIQAVTQRASINATETQVALLAQPSATATLVPALIDEIEYGQSIVDTSNNASDVRLVFNGSRNDIISIAARSNDFDPLLEVYQSGVLLVSDDDGGIDLNARISNYRLNSNGSYTIVLRTFSGVPLSGEYVLGITEMLDCPSAQVSRLLVGEFGRVTLTGGANRMRSSPTTNGTILATIPEGDVFEVFAGPVCDDGFAWYQVDFDGVVGWTAEGSNTDYFLELLPDNEPILLAGGQGLTNGDDLNAGEFQVEYYCSRRGLNTSNDTVDWFCTNASDVPVLTLVQSDFDQICRDTYDELDAFALQDGSSPSPAFRWRCYYVPE